MSYVLRAVSLDHSGFPLFDVVLDNGCFALNKSHLYITYKSKNSVIAIILISPDSVYNPLVTRRY
jgi:hypothetical protein